MSDFTSPQTTSFRSQLDKFLLPEITFFAALAIVAFWPLLSHSGGWLINTADIYDYFHQIDHFILRRLDAGGLPLWNSHLFCGIPFLANPQTTFFYPPRLVALLIGREWGMHPLIALHALAAAAFMTLHLKALGTRRAARLIGGMAYGFGGYAFSCAASGHLTMIWTMAWLPLIVHFQNLGWSRKGLGAPVVCGLAVGVQFLGGEPQSSYYTILLLLLNGAAHVIADRKLAVVVETGRNLAVAGAVSMVICAAQLFPLIEYFSMSDRASSNANFAASFPVQLNALPMLIMPIASYQFAEFELAGQSVYFGWEGIIYPGLIALIFAGVGLSQWRSRSHARAVTLVILGLILALGTQTPLYRVLYAIIPGLGHFRITARAMIFVLFGIAELGALGASRVFYNERSPLEDKRVKWAGISFLALISIIWAALTLSGRVKAGDVDTLAEDRELLGLFHPMCRTPLIAWSLAMGFLAAPWRRLGQWGPKAIVLLSAMELLLARPSIPLAEAARFQTPPTPPAASWEEPQKEDRPVRMDSIPGTAILINIGMTTGMENVNGYWPMIPHRYKTFIETITGGQFPENMRHQIPPELYYNPVHARFDLLNCPIRYDFDLETRAVRQYQFPIARPRAWFVPGAQSLESDEAILKAIMAPDFDPTKTVLITEETGLEKAPRPGENAEVLVVQGREGTIELKVTAPDAGWIALSQNYAPGWKCEIDGAATEVVRANYTFTALRVPKGTHKVEMTYRPSSLILGMIVSALAILGVGAFGMWSFVKRRRTIAGNP